MIAPTLQERLLQVIRPRPIYDRVEGAPRQPGDLVLVVAVLDSTTDPEHIGKTGRVVHLEYGCGCGQRFPDDPMIGVELGSGEVEEFWRDELAPATAGPSQIVIRLA